MRLLTQQEKASPACSVCSVSTRNRFSSLAVDDVDDDAECSEANFKRDVTPTIEAQVTSVNVETEHELLRVEGKINGRRALMLIDSGSTHDFMPNSLPGELTCQPKLARKT